MIMVKNKEEIAEVVPRLKISKRKPIGYWVTKFTKDNKCPTLIKKRWGNYVPFSISDGIPRYRDKDGLWRRLEAINSDGEVFSDDVGEYIVWKDYRVYIKFNAC